MESRLALLDWSGLAAIAAAMLGAAWFRQEPAVLLAGSVLAIGLVGRGWARLSLVALRYDRSLSMDRAFPGDRVELHARLDNRKPLPLSWATVEESLPPGLAVDGDEESLTVSLGWYQTARWRRSLLCRRRGFYPIGPAVLRSGDIFGLFSTRRQVDMGMPLIVYPQLRDLGALGLPSRHPLGMQNDPSRLFEDPTRPYGLRDYTPDTPFKSIAWAATARRGALQVRTVDPTATLHAALFLAVEGFAGAEGAEAFEAAVSVTASLAVHLLDTGQPTGLFANGRRADGGGSLALEPGRGDDQRRAVLERLAVVETVATDGFAALLDRHARDLARGASICVVAAVLDDMAALRLRELAGRGYAVQLLWLGAGQAPPGLAVRRLERPAVAASA